MAITELLSSLRTCGSKPSGPGQLFTLGFFSLFCTWFLVNHSGTIGEARLILLFRRGYAQHGVRHVRSCSVENPAQSSGLHSHPTPQRPGTPLIRCRRSSTISGGGYCHPAMSQCGSGFHLTPLAMMAASTPLSKGKCTAPYLTQQRCTWRTRWDHLMGFPSY